MPKASVVTSSPAKTIGGIFAQWQALNTDIENFTKRMRKKYDERTTNEKVQKKYKSRYPGFWKEVIADELGKQICEVGNFAKVEVLGPFGIGARVAFHCYAVESNNPSDISCSLTVEANLFCDEGGAILHWVDYNSDTGEFAKDTLGQRNGFNHVLVPIDNNATAAELLALMH